MAKYQTEFDLPVPLADAVSACRKAISNLGMKTTKQNGTRIAAREKFRFWGRNPISVEIAFQATSTGGTKLIFNESVFGLFGIFFLTEFKKFAQNLKREIELAIRSSAPGMVCQSCGAGILPGARFCGECGKEVLTTPLSEKPVPDKSVKDSRRQRRTQIITFVTLTIILLGIFVSALVNKSSDFTFWMSFLFAFIGLVIIVVFTIGLIGTIITKKFRKTLNKRQWAVWARALGGGVALFIMGVVLTVVIPSEAGPLTGAEWSLDHGSLVTLDWTDQNGKTVQTSAISGEVRLIADPDKWSAKELETLVKGNGGALFARLPQAGLYWAKVSEGKEAEFIAAMIKAGLNASPNMVLASRQEPPDSVKLVTSYNQKSDKKKQFGVTTGNLVIDDFENPMGAIGKNEEGKLVFVKKTPDDRIAVNDKGQMEVTLYPWETASHGAIVDYKRSNHYQLGENVLGGKSIMDIHSDAESDYILGTAVLLQGAADNKKRPVINISYGPKEYVSDPAKASENYPYHPGWEGYNQSNYGNHLDGLSATLNSDIKGAENAVITWAAGNSHTDITPTLVNKLSGTYDPWKIIVVGAVDAKGNIADYSNYSSSPGTMIYIPVTDMTAPTKGVTDKSFPITGTSFAAPQLQFLINQILDKRPDLDPLELRKALFDDKVADWKDVPHPADAKKKIRIPVIKQPLSPDTAKSAVAAADRLFPPKTPPPKTMVAKTPPSTTPAKTSSPTRAKPTLSPVLSAARDLTGVWKGTGWWTVLDYDGSPKVKLNADIVLLLWQDGNAVSGNFVHYVTGADVLSPDPFHKVYARSYSDNIRHYIPVNGEASVTNLYLTGYSGEKFEFTFTTDLMSGHVSPGPFYSWWGNKVTSEPKAIKLTRQPDTTSPGQKVVTKLYNGTFSYSLKWQDPSYNGVHNLQVSTSGTASFSNLEVIVKDEEVSGNVGVTVPLTFDYSVSTNYLRRDGKGFRQGSFKGADPEGFRVWSVYHAGGGTGEGYIELQIFPYITSDETKWTEELRQINDILLWPGRAVGIISHDLMSEQYRPDGGYLWKNPFGLAGGTRNFSGAWIISEEFPHEGEKVEYSGSFTLTPVSPK